MIDMLNLIKIGNFFSEKENEKHRLEEIFKKHTSDEEELIKIYNCLNSKIKTSPSMIAHSCTYGHTGG
jgi:hypothetical protein